MERRVALCWMAHPDDCEFLAAGAMALLGEKGYELHIASSTAGDGGSATLGPLEIAAIRREEGRRAAAMIDAKFHCLEMKDIHITFSEAIILKSIDFLRQVNPTLLITHSPVDYMVDHEVTAMLARSASNGFLVPNCGTLPVPSGARIPHLYYADPIGLVDHRGKLVKPDLVVDISRVYATKLAMLCEHQSQREWLKAHYGVDEYTRMLEEWSKLRGKEVGCGRGEGFRQHRGFGYPTGDVLGEMFR